MHPRQMRDTSSPVVPSFTYCTMSSSCDRGSELGERRVEQALLLGVVHLGAAARRARARRARNVLQLGSVAQHAMEPDVDVVPRAHVGRLLLHPPHLLGVGVAVEQREESRLGPWIELLDA